MADDNNKLVDKLLNIPPEISRLLAKVPSKRAIKVIEHRYFQIDHRVPYEIADDQADQPFNPDDYLLLDGSCNRAKSWSCEHCRNWREIKDAHICLHCYWASPEHYDQVAMKDVRRAEIIWAGAEVSVYDNLEGMAAEDEQSVPDYVKEIVEKHVGRNR